MWAATPSTALHAMPMAAPSTWSCTSSTSPCPRPAGGWQRITASSCPRPPAACRFRGCGRRYPWTPNGWSPWWPIPSSAPKHAVSCSRSATTGPRSSAGWASPAYRTPCPAGATAVRSTTHLPCSSPTVPPAGGCSPCSRAIWDWQAPATSSAPRLRVSAFRAEAVAASTTCP